MRKLSFFVMLSLALGLCSCGEKPSKQFKEMESELKSIDVKINEIADCDDLQMMHLAIYGLRSDMENYHLESEMTESEIEQLDGMIDQLEATWNGKKTSLGCDEMVTDDELDTSGEDDGSFDDNGL